MIMVIPRWLTIWVIAERALASASSAVQLARYKNRVTASRARKKCFADCWELTQSGASTIFLALAEVSHSIKIALPKGLLIG